MTPHVGLWELDVRDTQITSLDLSQNIALYGVSTDTVLKELDVTATDIYLSTVWRRWQRICGHHRQYEQTPAGLTS